MSVIPALVRITKLPADRRSTGAGPGAAANALPANAKSETAIVLTSKGFMDITLPIEMFFIISLFLMIFIFLDQSTVGFLPVLAVRGPFCHGLRQLSYGRY